MKDLIDNILDLIRGLVRPVLTFGFAGTILGLTVYLVLKYASPQIAQKFIEAVIPASTLMIGFWFGQQYQKRNQQ